ncbi:hypothetical protein [Natronolimnohabitans innermongolicus]|uniref:Uncharacterized protein n=1 Tax=Natronolimnohabitans innermongolicus JCM 12255 TaxID=1227499 RepID=L9WI07_9EURY|nr:hypothetical protein [Natronolimnohabitans innermongolicus]ELY48876.1 hypothetical protein C493_21351 [Natronolimnohabitans innermongolicus JCM 12255]
MSQSKRSTVRIDCPECGSKVGTAVPPGPGIHDERSPNRLRGTETSCHNCGHELEFYYY